MLREIISGEIATVTGGLAELERRLDLLREIEQLALQLEMPVDLGPLELPAGDSGVDGGEGAGDSDDSNEAEPSPSPQEDGPAGAPPLADPGSGPGAARKAVVTPGRIGREASDAPAEPRGTTNRDGHSARLDNETRIIALLQQRGPMPPREIAATLGLSPTNMGTKMSRLVDAGIVYREGQRQNLVYDLVARRDREIAERNGTKGNIGGRRPQDTMPHRRGRILTAITNQPGALTERQLAASLNLDREDVALICGGLLDDGHAAMLPDGTYAPTTNPEQGGGPEPVHTHPPLTNVAGQLHALLRQADRPVPWETLLHQATVAAQPPADSHDIRDALTELQASGLAVLGLDGWEALT